MFLPAFIGLAATPSAVVSAPTVVRVANFNSAPNPLSFSGSVNCTGGNLLVVAMSYRRDNTNYPSTVTYNGSALTGINKINGTNYALSMLYLNNPTTGTNTLAISDAFFTADTQITAWVISGANASPIDVSNVGNATPKVTVTTTTTVANTRILMFSGVAFDSFTAEPSTFTIDYSVSTGINQVRSGNKTQATAGSVSTGTIGADYNETLAGIVAIKP